MSQSNRPERVQRDAVLRWIPIAQMKVSPVAQREKLNQSRVDHIASSLDIEQLGTPTVNRRDGAFYLIDGWHRIEALRQAGWGDQQIQCWTYDGLSEGEEAEKFLKLSDTLAISSYDKFRVGVRAGRERECEIDRIVRANGLVVSRDKIDGAIGAVTTLARVYDRAGAHVLGRTLRIIRDAYGTPGFEARVIDGIGLLCARYNGDLEDQIAVLKLAKVHGGVSGLLQRAELIHRQIGKTKNQCVAAAAVEIINAGRGGSKLAAWFREAAA